MASDSEPTDLSSTDESSSAVDSSSEEESSSAEQSGDTSSNRTADKKYIVSPVLSASAESTKNKSHKYTASSSSSDDAITVDDKSEFLPRAKSHLRRPTTTTTSLRVSSPGLERIDEPELSEQTLMDRIIHGMGEISVTVEPAGDAPVWFNDPPPLWSKRRIIRKKDVDLTSTSEEVVDYGPWEDCHRHFPEGQAGEDSEGEEGIHISQLPIW